MFARPLQVKVPDDDELDKSSHHTLMSSKLDHTDLDKQFFQETLQTDFNDLLDDLNQQDRQDIFQECQGFPDLGEQVDQIRQSDHETTQELYQRHGQGEYRRENLKTCPVEACRDDDGNWTKWVFERMTEDQKQLYYRARDELKTEPAPLCCLSDNHVIRYLYSLRWDYDEAMSYIRNAEKMRQEYDCVSLDAEEF